MSIDVLHLCTNEPKSIPDGAKEALIVMSLGGFKDLLKYDRAQLIIDGHTTDYIYYQTGSSKHFLVNKIGKHLLISGA